MHQTTHFFNLGYGWLCKHCSAEAAERKHQQHHHPSGAQRPQGPAFARWVDDENWKGLVCTRCNISERLAR